MYQLTRNLTQEEIQKQGFDVYFIDHTTGVYPAAASGAPFSAASIAVTGGTFSVLARFSYGLRRICDFLDDFDAGLGGKIP